LKPAAGAMDSRRQIVRACEPNREAVLTRANIIANPNDENPMSILRQTEIGRPQQSPFDVVIQIRQRIENGGEMSTGFHRQQPLHIFQNEITGLEFAENFDHPMEESSSRIIDSLLLSRAAEGLTRKSGGEQLMLGNQMHHIVDIALDNLGGAESVAVDPASHGTIVIGPNCAEAAFIDPEPKPADAGE
jgi:hypothetical protein